MRIVARIAWVTLAFLALPIDASAWPETKEKKNEKESTPDIPAPDPDGLAAINAQVQHAYAQMERHVLKGDFEAAREACADYVELLTRRYGADHWRVATAALQEKSCTKAAQLTAEERERLRWGALNFRLGIKAIDNDYREALRYFEAASQTTEELLGEVDLFSTEPSDRHIKPRDSCSTQPREYYAYYLAVQEEKPEKSREILERLLAIRKQTVGPQHPLYASVLQHLAFANSKLQNCEEAAAQIQEAERIYASTCGSHSRELAVCQCVRLATLVECRKFAEAEEFAKAALKLIADFRTADPGLHIRVQTHLARALHGSRKFELALPAFQEISQDVENRAEAAIPIYLVEFYPYYVAALDDAGREADAANIRERIAQLQKRVAKLRHEPEPDDDLLELPPAETNSPRDPENVGSTGNDFTSASTLIEPHHAQNVLAFPLHASGGSGTAAPDESPAAELTATDPDGPTALDKQVNQITDEISRHLDKGEFAAARERCAASIELFTRRYGAGHWQVANAAAHEKSSAKAAQLTADEQDRLRRANLTFRLGLEAARTDTRAALRYFEMAWRTDEELLGEEDFFSTRPKEYYALYLTLTKPEQSREILERLVEIRKQILGTEHPLYASALQHLAYANGKLQNLEAALAQFQQAEQIYLSAFGRNSSEFAACQLYELITLVECRRFDEAEALAEQAINLSAKRQATDPWASIRLRIHQARALQGTGKLEAALSAFEGIDRALANISEQTVPSFQIDFCEFYVVALDEAGRKDDAAKIRQQIAKLEKQQARLRGESEPGDDSFPDFELPPAEGQ